MGTTNNRPSAGFHYSSYNTSPNANSHIRYPGQMCVPNGIIKESVESMLQSMRTGHYPYMILPDWSTDSKDPISIVEMPMKNQHGGLTKQQHPAQCVEKTAKKRNSPNRACARCKQFRKLCELRPGDRCLRCEKAGTLCKPVTRSSRKKLSI